MVAWLDCGITSGEDNKSVCKPVLVAMIHMKFLPTEKNDLLSYAFDHNLGRRQRDGTMLVVLSLSISLYELNLSIH